MKRILLKPSGVLLTVVLLSSIACKKDANNPNKVPNIEGTWELTSSKYNGKEEFKEWQPDTAFFLCNNQSLACAGHTRIAYLIWEFNGDHSLKEMFGFEKKGQSWDANCNCPKDSLSAYPAVSKYSWALSSDEKNIIFTYWFGTDTLPVIKLTSQELQLDTKTRLYTFKKK